MTESKPSVAAIVLNWNNYEDTVEAVAGLVAIEYENLTVIIVDNGSTDDSTNRLEKEFPEVEFIYNRENLGFPGGNNIGIRKALDQGFDYIWLLNNDIVIPDTFNLESLLSTVESHSLIDSVSPLLTEYPDKDQIWFRRGYVDRRSGITEHEEHHRWFLTLGQTQPYEPERELDAGVITTDYMPLCAALISRDVFDDIGLLDEEYFLYGSDVDFFIRAWENGHIAVTDMHECIHHKVSSSSDSAIGSTISYYTSRNRLLLNYKFPDIFLWSSLPLYCWWLVLHLGHRILNSEIPAAISLLRGAFDGFRGQTEDRV